MWPLRRLAHRIADRLVFGRRATPYQVLSEFSDRVARDLCEPTTFWHGWRRSSAKRSAPTRATVWLRVGDRFRPEASVAALTSPVDGSVPDFARSRSAIRERCSAPCRFAMPANDPMNPSKERSIQDLAAQAGLVLRNAALIEDLRASRQRLVAAQDEERRRIERNIHDGAQQQLVALAVKLRLADALVGKDEERAHAMLGELHGETSQALEDLRDLARGIYPPLLADKGLARRAGEPGAQVGRPGRRGDRRDRPVSAGGGGGRLLLVPRGAAERREVRGCVGGDGPARTVERQL